MKHFRILLIGLLAMLSSCIEEDDLDLPEQNETETTTSLALVSMLNHIDATARPACFTFIYPLHLQLSNDIALEITDQQGLKELANSQNADIYASEIVFPFLVSEGDVINSIDSDQEFFELLLRCELPTIRSDLERTHKQCFEFVYPFQMVVNEDSISFGSQEQFIRFYYNDQPANYLPEFVYPLELNKFTSETLTVKNQFALNQVLNACSGCPELFIEAEQRTLFEYQFTASVNGAEEFEWYVDDQLIATGTPERNRLTKQFEDGFHEICIKASSDDCVLGEVYCLEIQVEQSCPDLFFNAEEISYGSYRFEADFPGVETLDMFDWYVDGTLKKSGGLARGDSTDFFFDYEFEPGTYEVCLKSETPDCPSGTFYCEEIVVECLEMSFAWDLETFGYTYTADFELRDEVTYFWSAYKGDQLVKEEKREAGSDDDHDFLVEMERDIPYTICLKQEGACAEEKLCEEYVFQ